MFIVFLSILFAYVQPYIWEFFKTAFGKGKERFPLVLPKDGTDWEHALREGREKYPDSPFELPTVSGKKTVVIPTKFIEEIKSMPEGKLSFKRDVIERLIGDITMIGTHETAMIKAVRQDLTRNIPVLQSILQDEVKHAVKAKIGDCDDWTPIAVLPTFLQIISLMSSRVFVGLPLCREARWIHAMSGYTEDAVRGAMKLWTYNSWLRPLVALWLPELKAVRGHIKTAEELIAPVLEERLKALDNPKFEAPPDMLQFLLASGGPNAKTKQYQAKHQILATFTAIHTTAMNACHAVFDLAAHPEFLGPLREELDTVLEEEGGELSKIAMTKLKKLDSLFRETQRVNPANLLGMGRKVTSDLALSDQTVLPKGTFIAVDAQSIYRNPDIYPEPEKYDAFRFAKKREEPGSEHRYQAVSTGPDNLAFGHGTHACPGRFFAVNETKVLLAYLIQNFDWKFQDGTSRPANLWSDTISSPDPRVEVLFKRRVVQS